MDSQISNLLDTSKKVILDCCLENGAIVAANSDRKDYPKNANDYRFVWPRDAAYILYAAKLLGIDHIHEPFIRWLMERAEDFSDSGMLFQRYCTNGLRDPQFGHQYQPDQSGALLWALIDNGIDADIIDHLSGGICKMWNNDHFSINTHDLWEERQTFPRLRDNFTYSLAACSYSLKKAYEITGKEDCLKKSEEMEGILRNAGKDYYPRMSGKIPDSRTDASVLSLVWPFCIDIDDKLKKSVSLVKEKLLTPLGVKRYENDEYDGTVDHMSHLKKGGGGWPLLTFWYIIALKKLGEREEAKKLFGDYIKQFPEGHIPEQVFDNEIQTSPSPLCWSHAMFVICAKELGY